MIRPKTPSPPGSGGAAATILDRDLRAFVESLPQIVWRTTPSGESDFYGRRWYDYTGLTPDESLGRKWLAAVHSDDRAGVAAAWDAAVRGEAPYDLQCRIAGRDGVARWFLVRGTPLRDATGTVVRWYGTCTDIEAQKRVEAQFSAIADAIPQMVWTALPNGTLDYLNARIYEYAGREHGDLTGWSWTNVVHRDDLAIALAARRRATESGQPYEAELRLLRADGAYRWHMMRASAVRDPDSGVVTRWFGTCTDIDELHGAAARDAFLARADELFAVELEPEAIVRACGARGDRVVRRLRAVRSYHGRGDVTAHRGRAPGSRAPRAVPAFGRTSTSARPSGPSDRGRVAKRRKRDRAAHRRNVVAPCRSR